MPEGSLLALLVIIASGNLCLVNLWSVNAIHRSHKTVPHIDSEQIILSNTKAEPIFLATPDRGWNSKLTLSTTTSIAVLTISANNTNTIPSMTNNVCMAGNSSQNAKNASGTKSINSC